jgi:hypothetical protein
MASSSGSSAKQLFSASRPRNPPFPRTPANDLDLPRAPLAGLDVDVKYSLQALHPGYRRVAFGWGLVQPVSTGGLMPLASPTPFSRRDTHTKFAVRREAAPSEHPMKTSKIYAWLGYKGS